MRRRHDAGFSLVEILISILALSLISGFILELFILSAKLNSQVIDRDNADTQIISIIETFKLQDDPARLFEDAYFDGADYTSGDGSLSITKYYDKDWSPTKHDTISDSSAYHLIEIYVDLSGGNTPLLFPAGFDTQGNDYGETLSSAYCEVRVSVFTYTDGEKKEIASQTAGKYFKNMAIEAVAQW